MRIQNITQDFQKMIHELEELWGGIFEGGGEVVNSLCLIDCKQVFSRMEPESIIAGKSVSFLDDWEECLLKRLVFIIFNKKELFISQ